MSDENTESENSISENSFWIFLCVCLCFAIGIVYISERNPSVVTYVHKDGTPLTPEELVGRQNRFAEKQRIDEIARLDRIKAETDERRRDLNVCCAPLSKFGWDSGSSQKAGRKTQHVSGYTR
jgi:hypothetical protein